MTGVRKPLFLCLALAALAPCAAIAENSATCGGTEVSARINEAMDGASFKLADGRIVRLASVIAPLPIDGDTKAPADAKALLAQIANGKDATILLASNAVDRYGRLSANAVLIEGKEWLEATLLARGAARVFQVSNEKCAAALLAFERKARDARLGLWSEARFRVFDAEEVEALLAAAGRFVIVEGAIRRVGEARGRIYLDFGRRFTEDFTILVSDQLRKALVQQGSDPKNWRGRRIRVRGILFSWGGPAIEVNLAQAIEFLDQDTPKSD